MENTQQQGRLMTCKLKVSTYVFKGIDYNLKGVPFQSPTDFQEIVTRQSLVEPMQATVSSLQRTTRDTVAYCTKAMVFVQNLPQLLNAELAP